MTSTEPIGLTVRRSSRKTLSMSVQKDGNVLVRAPFYTPDTEIRDFAEKHMDWIRKQRTRMQEAAKAREEIMPLSLPELEQLARDALRILPERAAFYAGRLGVSYGRITIRNQKSKWGSCSSAGNLNFNCLLMLAPPEVLDSVVVHELCHRKYMNHSAAFYTEVLRVLPDYRTRDRWLKENGGLLMQRMRA